MLRVSKALLMFLTLMPAITHASNDFKCTVNKVYALNDNGVLVSESGFTAPDVGDEFVVNRQSGQISGRKITNTMSGKSPQVYSHLPAYNSYTAITIYEPNLTVDLLQIHEYVKSESKPFIFKGAFGEVVTGVCLKI